MNRWSALGGAEDLTPFVGELTRLRQRFPQIKQDRWLEGKKADGSYDVKWLTPGATEMSEDDWNFPDGRFVSYVLAAPPSGGAPLFIVLNGAEEDVDIVFPEWPGAGRWQNVLDTSNGDPHADALAPGAHWTARAKSVLAFAGQP